MLPQAGGQYVFLREAYGPLAGFLCGWTFFLANQSAIIASLAVGFAQNLSGLLPLSTRQQKAAAAAAIVLLTAINYRGVGAAGWLQSVLTGLTVGAMVGLVALAYALVHGMPAGAAPLGLPAGHGLHPSAWP
jgi:APA family basic amino acid/polyamine antiporter